jgi:hypothetical protein
MLGLAARFNFCRKEPFQKKVFKFTVEVFLVFLLAGRVLFLCFTRAAFGSGEPKRRRKLSTTASLCEKPFSDVVERAIGEKRKPRQKATENFPFDGEREKSSL